MTAKAASNIEPQAAAVFDFGGLPGVGTWRARPDGSPDGLDVRGSRRLTLLNVTTVAVELRRDGFPLGDLPGKDMRSVPIDPAGQIVTFEPKEEREAGGFFVAHDFEDEWELSGPAAKHPVSLATAATVALTNHPESSFTVALVADGGIRGDVGPGEAQVFVLTAQQARSIVLQRRRGSAAADAKARGLLCLASSRPAQ